MTTHALLSPSGAHRWMRCPGSLALEQPFPESTSVYADEGTRAHELAARILRGENIDDADPGMLADVRKYTDVVQASAQDGALLVEKKVNLSDTLGSDEQFGTCDAVIIKEEEIEIHDLKYGRGTPVSAKGNEQLRLYALGALKDFGLLHEPKRVRMFIHQVRLAPVEDEVVDVEELLRWGREARVRADLAIAQMAFDTTKLDLEPGEKQCRFCKAKSTCPALRAKVENEVRVDFDDLDDTRKEVEAIVRRESEQISRSLKAVDLVEMWCKAVREEAFRRLAEGQDVPDFKLVEGRRGARKWSDEAEVEGTLKAMRLTVEQMYDLSLISPTSAEKLAKAGTIGPRQWPKLKDLITQPAGKPHVAPADDKRPAITIAAQPTDFELVA